MNRFSPDLCHNELLASHTPLLRYREDNDFNTWRAEVKATLCDLIGDMPERVSANVQIEWKEERDTYTEYRFTFDTEPSASVPCHLLIPHKAKKPCPVVICLQGHSSGMHISLGKMIYPGDEKSVKGGDRDFAIRIVREGYAALVLEQRAFGERKSEVMMRFDPEAKTTCMFPSLAALLLGRTIIGERVWDVSRAIDALSEFPEIDLDRVACMGNSGGGTATYYAACLDERIKIAMPSCSVCSFNYSIGVRRHCTCNYIPKLAKYVDMGDLASLIAPRKLIVVAGEKDSGFKIEGTHQEYEIIEKIFERAGAKDNCRLVVGEEGHRFYADLAWPVFHELAGWDD